ncbi:hypothetical protein KUTeg_002231 [Tegillarca granosa]|uniref:Uncharacterized protein n=1 Tax=Tegillarca granosa TaxID=220873 RepID=A0ABQ9FTQ9_TEGGR|nr:hypothetical protein KUTeg_002231 [Tegillarca granosa]
MASAEVDMWTKRPRTSRQQYTNLSDEQIKNIKKDPQAFFSFSKPEKPYPEKGWYLDRYATCTNEHMIRGPSKSMPYCWIDYQWNRFPPELHNTCRLGASERWGPEKNGKKMISNVLNDQFSPNKTVVAYFVGSRTVQHFNQPEDTNRFLTTEVYRRHPTNRPGQINVSYGRPAEGYYLKRNPNTVILLFTFISSDTETWFGSTVPLNRTGILQTIYPKTTAEYEAIRKLEQTEIKQRKGKYPEYSEYTDRFGMTTKEQPIMSA